MSLCVSMWIYECVWVCVWEGIIVCVGELWVNVWVWEYMNVCAYMYECVCLSKCLYVCLCFLPLDLFLIYLQFAAFLALPCSQNSSPRCSLFNAHPQRLLSPGLPQHNQLEWRPFSATTHNISPGLETWVFKRMIQRMEGERAWLVKLRAISGISMIYSSQS